MAEVSVFVDSPTASVIHVEGVGMFVRAHIVDELREENQALRALLEMKETYGTGKNGDRGETG